MKAITKLFETKDPLEAMFDAQAAAPTATGPQASNDAAPEGHAMDPGMARLFMLAGNATFTVVSKATGKRLTFRLRRPDPESEQEYAQRMATMRATWGAFRGQVGPCPAKYKVTRKPIWISVLNGPDNESSYAYLGTIWENAQGYEYAVGRKSKIAADAPSQQAAAWLTKCLMNPERLAAQATVYHAGKCGRCGRKLTVPSSIETGLGPECAGKLAA